jgi:hypothetical protein
MTQPQTTLSRRDEMALRLACAMIGSNFLIKDADDAEKPTMGIKTQSLYAVEIADAMIAKLDEAENARTN